MSRRATSYSQEINASTLASDNNTVFRSMAAVKIVNCFTTLCYETPLGSRRPVLTSDIIKTDSYAIDQKGRNK